MATRKELILYLATLERVGGQARRKLDRAPHLALKVEALLAQAAEHARAALEEAQPGGSGKVC